VGNLRSGPPDDLVLSLRKALGIRYFIETGTFTGKTAEWAARCFQRVYTVEFSQEIWFRAQKRLGPLKNVISMFGHSAEVLSKVVSELDGPAICWLDAHWSGGDTYGSFDECPLLAELKVLRSVRDSIILIDDARLFLSPPPPPHDPKMWPDIATIIDRLNSDERRDVIVIDDVIVAYPKSASAEVMAYCQFVNSRLEKERLSRAPFLARFSRLLLRLLGKLRRKIMAKLP